MIQSLEPRVMLAAIDPYNMGKGDWIWYLSSARSNTGTTTNPAYPNLFLAHAPFPIVSYHSAFPYYTFGKYCDAVMPQDYFGAIKVTPQYMVTWQNDQWNTLYNGWKGTSKADGIKPLVPISQGWNDASTNTTTGAD